MYLIRCPLLQVFVQIIFDSLQLLLQFCLVQSRHIELGQGGFQFGESILQHGAVTVCDLLIVITRHFRGSNLVKEFFAVTPKTLGDDLPQYILLGHPGKNILGGTIIHVQRSRHDVYPPFLQV